MMKTFLLTPLSFILFLISTSLAQTNSNLSESDKVILFEKFDNVKNQLVYFQRGVVNFQLNGETISSIQVNNYNFNFIIGLDNNSFCLINYYFAGKSEKSTLEFFLFDDEFKVTFYKKLSYFYEEPLPKIFPFSSDKVLLFTPSTGNLKILNAKGEKEINLVKEDELEYFQERIGHIFALNDKILITLSHLKKNNNLISKVYSLKPNTFEIEQIELDVDIIHKIFKVDSKIYYTGLETEPTFQYGFYHLDINEINFAESKAIKISDELIEGQVKDLPEVFFTNNCFFKIKVNDLVKLNHCIADEIILSAYFINDKIYLLTRKNLTSNLHTLNFDFLLLESEPINQYLKNPELRVFSKKNLMIVDNNKIIYMKNISEE